LAALTLASVCCNVMSPWMIRMRADTFLATAPQAYLPTFNCFIIKP
jgi:hypothetical protein